MKERDYDVIVYGAGPEGVAAALAAAERSGSVLLADEGSDVGGSAVCGLLNCWRGDANPAPVLMELLRRLSKRAWGRLIFEPEELAQELRKLLALAGVDVLLGARVVKVKARGRHIKSVSLAGYDGKVKLSAWSYIDASQEFSLARLAGCAFEGEGETEIALLARVGGIDTRVPGVFDHDTLAQYAGPFTSEQASEEIPAALAFPALVPCLRGGTAILNAAGGGVAVDEGPLGRTNAESRCRADAYAALGFLQRNVPGYENCCLIHFAGQPLAIARPQPARRRTETAADEIISGSIEDISVMSCRNPDDPAAFLTVPLGNLMSGDMENLLFARSEGLSSEQVPLLFASGAAAGRVAVESLLYDGDIVKLDEERLRKAIGNQ